MANPNHPTPASGEQAGDRSYCGERKDATHCVRPAWHAGDHIFEDNADCECGRMEQPPPPPESQQVCEICNGTGKIKRHPQADHAFHAVEIPCVKCQGSGRVPLPTGGEAPVGREQFVAENAVSLLAERDAKIERQRVELDRLNGQVSGLKSQRRHLRDELGFFARVLHFVFCTRGEDFTQCPSSACKGVRKLIPHTRRGVSRDDQQIAHPGAAAIKSVGWDGPTAQEGAGGESGLLPPPVAPPPPETGEGIVSKAFLIDRSERVQCENGRYEHRKVTRQVVLLADAERLEQALVDERGRYLALLRDYESVGTRCEAAEARAGALGRERDAYLDFAQGWCHHQGCSLNPCSCGLAERIKEIPEDYSTDLAVAEGRLQKARELVKRWQQYTVGTYSERMARQCADELEAVLGDC